MTLAEVNDAVRKHLQYEDLQIVVVTKDARFFRDALVAETGPARSNILRRGLRMPSVRTSESAASRCTSGERTCGSCRSRSCSSRRASSCVPSPTGEG